MVPSFLLESLISKRNFLSIERRPRGDFLVDFSRPLLNEFKRVGLLCALYHRAGKPSYFIPSTRGSSSRPKSKKKAKTHVIPFLTEADIQCRATTILFVYTRQKCQPSVNIQLVPIAENFRMKVPPFVQCKAEYLGSQQFFFFFFSCFSTSLF